MWKGWTLRRKCGVAITVPMELFLLAALLQLAALYERGPFDEDALHIISFVFLIIGMVVGTLTMVIVVRNVGRRLDLLGHDAMRLARGDPLAPYERTGGDKIDALGRGLARASDLLRERELELRDATWVAERANESKTTFLSRMSHELRTPLNAMLGFAQLLEFEDLTPEQRDDVDQILRGGHHLLELINEVLDISRIEAGELALTLEPVGVHDVAAEVVGLLLPTARHAKIQLVDDTGRWPTVRVQADRQRLVQVLLNLMSNAIKYNRPAGTVTVVCSVGDESVQISVVDTGRGIAPENLELLFAPFERLGAERSGVEGTGIGLALSRHLARAMSGTLSVSSRVNVGSTFSLELPIAETEATEAPPVSRPRLGESNAWSRAEAMQRSTLPPD